MLCLVLYGLGVACGFGLSMYVKDKLKISWDADGHKTLDISQMTDHEKAYFSRIGKDNNGELTGKD